MSRPQLLSRPSSVAAQSKTIVLVSGGNAGIGLAIVESLSKLPNYQILLGCRDTSKGEMAAATIGAPINVNPIQLDVTDDESVEHAYLTVAQMFGKLDILINNAGTAGQDVPEGTSKREEAAHIYSVNVTSAALLTDKMAPLLEKSQLAKVMFISSIVGSIQRLSEGDKEATQGGAYYGSSKAARNFLTVYYARKYPRWKVNSVDPGTRATAMSGMEVTEETDPKHGAVRVTELAKEGLDGVTGTFSTKEESLPW